MPLDRLLLATDGSERARDAAAFARQLLPDADVRAALVAPAGLPGPIPQAAARGPSGEEDGQSPEAVLAAFLRALDLPADAGEIREGSVAREIARAATAFDADAVVVGGHPVTAVEGWFVGARGRSILRQVPCHVLVGRAFRENVRRIVVATDFGDAAAHAGALARDLARAHDAELVAVHAMDPALWGSALLANTADGHTPHGEEVSDAVDDALAKYATDVLHGDARTERVSGPPVKGLSAFAQENGVDLLVAGTHGPGALERAFLGSVAEGLANGAPCPVLVVKPSA